MAVDGDSGGEGQEASSPVPDSDPGPDQGLEGTGGSSNQWPGPASDMEPDPGPGVPGAGADSFRDQPDGGHEGAPGRQRNVNSDGGFDRIGDRPDAGASGIQDQDNGESAQRKPQASADGSQPAQRAEGTTGEKLAEGQGGEIPESQSKDRPPAQNQSSDVGTDLGEQGGTSSEAAPDQNPDDPRWATVLSAIESVKAENQEIKAANQEMRQQIGDLKADLDSSEAEKAHLKSELSDLRTELETFKAERQQRQPDQPDSGEQPEPPSTPDTIKQSERSEEAKLGSDPRDAANEADTGAVDRRGTHASGMEGHKTEPTGRHIFSAENVGAAAAGIALGQSVVQTFTNLPPEVGVGVSAAGFVGASMATSFVKRILEKRRD